MSEPLDRATARRVAEARDIPCSCGKGRAAFECVVADPATCSHPVARMCGRCAFEHRREGCRYGGKIRALAPAHQPPGRTKRGKKGRART